MRVLSALLNPFFSHDAHGGLPTLFAATSPEAVPGRYYAPKGFQELTGDTAPAKIPGVAKDTELAKRLWSETEQLTGARFAVS